MLEKKLEFTRVLSGRGEQIKKTIHGDCLFTSIIGNIY